MASRSDWPAASPTGRESLEPGPQLTEAATEVRGAQGLAVWTDTLQQPRAGAEVTGGRRATGLSALPWPPEGGPHVIPVSISMRGSGFSPDNPWANESRALEGGPHGIRAATPRRIAALTIARCIPAHPWRRRAATPPPTVPLCTRGGRAPHRGHRPARIACTRSSWRRSPMRHGGRWRSGRCGSAERRSSARWALTASLRRLDHTMRRTRRWPRRTPALDATRPTAVNLRWALDRVRAAVGALPERERADAAWREADAICREDEAINRAIGVHGLALLRAIAGAKSGPVNVMTHCNAGALATCGWGTATAPLFLAHAEGLALHVWVSETRPRLQGANLTAWEMGRRGLPHTLVADAAGPADAARRRSTSSWSAADRVAANGDVCKQDRTYSKALAAQDNGVPFYVGLPSPTLDSALASGDAIRSRRAARTRCSRSPAATATARPRPSRSRPRERVRSTMRSTSPRPGWSPASSPSAESSRRPGMPSARCSRSGSREATDPVRGSGFSRTTRGKQSRAA